MTKDQLKEIRELVNRLPMEAGVSKGKLLAGATVSKSELIELLESFLVITSLVNGLLDEIDHLNARQRMDEDPTRTQLFIRFKKQELTKAGHDTSNNLSLF